MVILLFIIGLVFGSFYNVVIYRIPRGLSLIKPGSSCPSCKHQLTVLELIPIISFMWQGGRCKSCKERISWRYPLVEFITGLGFAIFTIRSTALTSLVVSLVLFSLLLILALIDLEHKLLPNVLTLPGTVLGLLLALLGWNITFVHSLLGCVVGFFLLFLIALISRGGMGMGDAKMMALIGSFLGWKAVFYTLFGAALFGSIGGMFFLYITKQDRKTPIPFGPYLAIAALIVAFKALPN